MRISDWSSDVCSSDLFQLRRQQLGYDQSYSDAIQSLLGRANDLYSGFAGGEYQRSLNLASALQSAIQSMGNRSEEHTSELQSLMRISYAVFCLKKKTYTKIHSKHTTI